MNYIKFDKYLLLLENRYRFSDIKRDFPNITKFDLKKVYKMDFTNNKKYSYWIIRNSDLKRGYTQFPSKIENVIRWYDRNAEKINRRLNIRDIHGTTYEELEDLYSVGELPSKREVKRIKKGNFKIKFEDNNWGVYETRNERAIHNIFMYLTQNENIFGHDRYPSGVTNNITYVLRKFYVVVDFKRKDFTILSPYDDVYFIYDMNLDWPDYYTDGVGEFNKDAIDKFENKYGHLLKYIENWEFSKENSQYEFIIDRFFDYLFGRYNINEKTKEIEVLNSFENKWKIRDLTFPIDKIKDYRVKLVRGDFNDISFYEKVRFLIDEIEEVKGDAKIYTDIYPRMVRGHLKATTEIIQNKIKSPIFPEYVKSIEYSNYNTRILDFSKMNNMSGKYKIFSARGLFSDPQSDINIGESKFNSGVYSKIIFPSKVRELDLITDGMINYQFPKFIKDFNLNVTRDMNIKELKMLDDVKIGNLTLILNNFSIRNENVPENIDNLMEIFKQLGTRGVQNLKIRLFDRKNFKNDNDFPEEELIKILKEKNPRLNVEIKFT
jgi:hypothetical protein